MLPKILEDVDRYLLRGPLDQHPYYLSAACTLKIEQNAAVSTLQPREADPR